MKKYTLLLCMLIPAGAWCQDRPVSIKLAPLCLIDDIGFPTIQGGIEFPLGRRFSWYNEVGFRYRSTRYEKTDTSFVSPKGFKAKTELRYYITGHREGTYVAANLFYYRDVHNASSSYYLQQDSSKQRTDNFGITKNIWGLNLLLGKQVYLGRRFLVDLYGGFGIRSKEMSSINQEFDHERDELILPADITIYGIKSKMETKGGNSVIAHLTLGVRVGLVL